MKFFEYKEKKTRGSPDFPLEYYFIDREHSQYVMPLHWHREIEIIRVLNGRLHLFLNNMEYLLERGDVVFVGPGVLHRGEPEECIYECIVFDLNMLCRYSSGKIADQLLPLIMGSAEIERLCCPEDTQLSSTVGALFASIEKGGEFYQLEVYSLVAKTVYLLYKNSHITLHSASKRSDRQRDTMATLLDYIEKNLTAKITLSELSRVSGVNEKYLCRFFKEFSGYTPTDYVNRMRLERAMNEMTVGGKSITDAAFDSGFNELSYFSRMFKKYMKVTPREYLRARKK
ncbi:MAG: helix-turn-helix transcriptional regulator [Clostridia bacterium]|nr:helix-turn-helix transcriptional regulator [Clostridia bacterium]